MKLFTNENNPQALKILVSAYVAGHEKTSIEAVATTGEFYVTWYITGGNSFRDMNNIINWFWFFRRQEVSSSKETSSSSDWKWNNFIQ